MWRLFEGVHAERKVRLLGIYASGFGAVAGQLPLFADTPSAVDQIRDTVASRFGEEAITRASLLGRRERRNPSDRPEREPRTTRGSHRP